MGNKYLFVANWKMFLDFNESVYYATKNFDTIIELSKLPEISIVLCPTYPAIYPLVKIFESTKIRVGAQNCSAHSKGAFTGQVSAQTLKDIGCNYCVIGHSERRIYNHESDELVAKKIDLLIAQKISPIICIGETLRERQENKTLVILGRQLQKILKLIKVEENTLNGLPIIVAYEPCWCIGTGVTPGTDDLNSIFAWIYSQTQKYAPYANWNLIYGGSVTHESIQNLIKIDKLSGFLVGKSSTNFEKFEKIIKRIYYPL
jgi:triosephosphate isomerase (TIM)